MTRTTFLTRAAIPALFLLAACEAPVATAPVPAPQPEAPVVAKPAKPQPSARSREFSQYYARSEARLKSQGLLRTDQGGADAPFTRRALVENFIRIALYDEYTVRGGRFVAQETPSALRRWEEPVRLKLYFGDSVDEAQRKRDRDMTRRYVQRLARLTGADIRMTEGAANYHVLVMNTDELAASGPRLENLVPGIGRPTLNEIARLPRYTFCSVYAFSEQGNDNRYSAAVAVIRAEHPPLLRQSCLHEELAQGLGLANDSPAARPSIFNDDEEFALLTRQDELLLKILYDKRLKLGMTPETARPIVEQIAAELMPGES
ncbi:hypothetical protein BV394_04005 [Brevirhabdus pacifica]|uniref:Uncharacterized protein n=1 Tax=Brevirhabdus pacifica TaxID=1267768 RepID=A0A1U7DGA2_9RHOB|nr:DUF2927 domain-containing protein [Brevirhabdus pacifica]APX88991.1 hypothetical protein BV394_04005 [Brevirhabdus pacifica]OWU80212.1 hypothetical protein ATO5_04685 [Loktanella sp. 22II-4b]PJJ86444.1 Protein of unknown function (DUF2927) [Brevirhabdus pacifica]